MGRYLQVSILEQASGQGQCLGGAEPWVVPVMPGNRFIVGVHPSCPVSLSLDVFAGCCAMWLYQTDC